MIIPIILALLSLIPLGNSNPSLQNFLSCLSNRSDSSNPVLKNVYTNTSSSYESVLSAYVRDLRFSTPETPKPLAIVTVSHESHVQATVVCAKSHGLQIRIRSGGHDYEGLSYVSQVPFVVLDMFKLRAIDIDMATETAWVQAGATNGELYYHIGSKSNVHGFPAGVCPTVGVGGHFSGGGYGNMLRKYGLTVDNVIDAQIVDVNGRILDRKSMGEDLFWAIRGGGGASFCVILSWTIKLVPVTEKVTVFNKGFLLNKGALDVFYQWQQVASTKLPKELYVRAMADPSGNTLNVRFVGFFLGETDSLLPLLYQSLPLLNLTREDCLEMSWLNSTLFWNGFPSGTPVEALLNRTRDNDYVKIKSDYIKKMVSKDDLRKIFKMLIRSGISRMQWNPYGGKMSEISETETAFAHRAGYLFKIQYLMDWYDDGNTKRSIDAMRGFYAAMAPYVSSDPRESFLNYRDIDIGSNLSNETNFEKSRIYGMKYFKGNFERLTKVKAMVDPDNFFRNEQSIPPRNDNMF